MCRCWTSVRSTCRCRTRHAGSTLSGDWRFDANSLVVINADNRPQDLRQLSYSVESVDIAPDGADLATAPCRNTAGRATITGDIPVICPHSFDRSHPQVTEGADGPAAKAAAIQAYLRSGEFSYSTERLPGSGYQALENFLLRDRRGLLRAVRVGDGDDGPGGGDPVAGVGRLPAGRSDGDSWNVSIRDMHAWPELYFAGYGWVRFEPTPATVTGAAPSWTVQTEDNPGDDSVRRPVRRSDRGAIGQRRAVGGAEPGRHPDGRRPRTRAWGRTVLVVAGGLVLLMILAAPATIRVRRRTARLSGERAAEDRSRPPGPRSATRCWTTADPGRPAHPRSIGNELASRLDQDEAASMSRVATLVERSRYARSFADDRSGREAARHDAGDPARHRRAGQRGPQATGGRLAEIALPAQVQGGADGSGKRPT